MAGLNSDCLGDDSPAIMKADLLLTLYVLVSAGQHTPSLLGLLHTLRNFMRLVVSLRVNNGQQMLLLVGEAKHFDTHGGLRGRP